MLLRLLRCGICGNWYRPATRNHCQVCNATLMVWKGRQYYFNQQSGRQVVSAVPQYHPIVKSAIDVSR